MEARSKPFQYFLFNDKLTFMEYQIRTFHACLQTLKGFDNPFDTNNKSIPPESLGRK